MVRSGSDLWSHFLHILIYYSRLKDFFTYSWFNPHLPLDSRKIKTVSWDLLPGFYHLCLLVSLSHVNYIKKNLLRKTISSTNTKKLQRLKYFPQLLWNQHNLTLDLVCFTPMHYSTLTGQICFNCSQSYITFFTTLNTLLTHSEQSFCL